MLYVRTKKHPEVGYKNRRQYYAQKLTFGSLYSGTNPYLLSYYSYSVYYTVYCTYPHDEL